MTFKLVVFAALAVATHAGFINSGHPVGPTIGTSYVSNPGLLRAGSSYSSPYGYGTSGYPLSTGRSYSSGVPTGHVVVRPASYGSPYGYGGRNTPGAVSYPSVSGFAPRSLSYPTPTFASPVLRNGYSGFSGFNGGYGAGYQAPLNYQHQPLAYQTSPIGHHPAHGSFSELGTGYGY
ncbi:prisilkin-39-like [Neodiprion pinetum]|uniref:prisilkin-39-like n=1 Tax=Neodiprion fabricii TaxID=2872261 RepID=UPI001ED921B3|nr:prisilkin-39-like [Neodiprion fabricii]XP_046484818.1 prisilkin-39-like [Neodiprion pinetum]XP_046618861.1 prisilkin-39-like [Neodiprion virginianus]